eukprot:243025_1
MSTTHSCNEEERRKSKKLLLKICSKILSYPDELRYQSINYDKICKKLSDCQACIQMLLHCGFSDINSHKDSDRRLVFDSSKIKALQQMKNNISISDSNHVAGKLCDIEYKLNSNSNDEEKQSIVTVESDKRVAQLINSLTQYDKSGVKLHETFEDIRLICIQTLNLFSFVVSTYHSDEEFQYINSQLINCNISKCKIRKRNNRCRNGDQSDCKIYETTDSNVMVFMQCMDKIHCYYQHSIDTGFRPATHDTQTMRINKYNKIKPLINKSKRIISKYITKPAAYDCINNKMFSGGYFYSYVDIEPGIFWNNNENNPQHLGPVIRFHSSLQQELIYNKGDFRMTYQQFQAEFFKAKMHCQTNYFRKCIAKSIFRVNKKDNVSLLLSLLVYCNFDALQNEFSKTYRKLSPDETNEDLIKRHSHFYHWGIYLIQAVHHIGQLTVFQTDTKRRSDNQFIPIVPDIQTSFYSHFPLHYHGISEELCFSDCAGMNFQVPLSTSSDYYVAMRFANVDGVVLQFRASYLTFNCPVYWLSDYPHEFEHIFMGSKFLGQSCYLFFDNVIHVPTGVQMKAIIHGLYLLQCYFGSRVFLKRSTPQLQSLVMALIEHEMFTYYGDKNCEPMKSLNLYAQKLVHYHCTAQNTLVFDFTEEKNKQKFNLLDSKFMVNDFINMEFVLALFPNVTTVNIYKSSISNIEMTAILMYLIENTNTKLKKVYLRCWKPLDIIPIHSEYKKCLKDTGFCLSDVKAIVKRDNDGESEKITAIYFTIERSDKNKINEAYEEKQQTVDSICICKNRLKPLEANKCYTDAWVGWLFCNLCLTMIWGDTLVYHCDKSKHHQQGYDICVNCINNENV